MPSRQPLLLDFTSLTLYAVVMIYRTSYVTVISLFCFALFCSQVQAQNFRSTSWGDSRQQVISQEGEPNADEGDFIAYAGEEIAGIPVAHAYLFTNEDELAMARYFVTKEYSSRNEYLRVYNNFSELLVSRYGKPDDENAIWTNDLYRDDPSNYGMAIAVGHMLKYTVWELEEESIELLVTGGEYEINLYVNYRSHEYFPKLEADRENEDAAKF